MCDLCPSENTKLPDKQLLEGQEALSYSVGPLAVLWISSSPHKDHFGWKLIKDRLNNCFSDAHEQVGVELIHLVHQLIFWRLAPNFAHQQ
jgi:hypothetical protein